ncbi:MAG: hypothetical protein KBF57_07985, partial [Saprospiraceae bacterium]|nr:hypothetical protein [Saprospiraceae bacterium]
LLLGCSELISFENIHILGLMPLCSYHIYFRCDVKIVENGLPLTVNGLPLTVNRSPAPVPMQA